MHKRRRWILRTYIQVFDVFFFEGQVFDVLNIWCRVRPCEPQPCIRISLMICVGSISVACR